MGNTGQNSNWNNPFRALEGELNKERPPNDHTPQGVVQGTPGVGTSITGGPTLECFHKMMQDSPGFVKEVLRFQRIIAGNPPPENEEVLQGLKGNRAGEEPPKEAPMVHTVESDGDSSEEQREEVRKLKKQVELLQERLKENNRVESRVQEESRRSKRREDTRAKSETGFETAGASHSYRLTIMPRSSRGNPFAQHILEDPLPTHFKPVNYEYDGTADPEDHVAKFENVALLHQYTEGVKCRVFSTTLVGAAQQWFKQLAPGSIASFEEFYDIFLQQFSSARRSVKSSMHLITVKQTLGESLREYVAKFNMVALETPAADTKIKIHAIIQGLRSGALFDSLLMNEPQDFDDLFKRITPFIHLEEAWVARQEEIDKGRKRREKRIDREEVEQGERMVRDRIPRGPFRYDKRPREYQGGLPRERETTIIRGARPPTHFFPVLTRGIHEISEKGMVPLNRLLSDILETARRTPGFIMPWGFTEETKGVPGKMMCLYPNQYGHSTDRCKSLRIVVDKMIKEGKLRQFEEERTDDMARRGGEDINNPPPPPPPGGIHKQKIYMIFGGEGVEVSNQSRRTEVRQARQVEDALMEIRPGQIPEITFGPQDDRSMVRPHNDALVIVADVAGVWVIRTFVDTGNSVTVMYFDCLKQLDMNANLQPPTGSLFGFSGEMVAPIGSIHLPVTLGRPSANTRRMVEFVILDLPNSAYNMILGRPNLNAFQAVVSTYYLKMKFPVREGVGEVYRSQVSSKECYVKAITEGNKRKSPVREEREDYKRLKKIPGCPAPGELEEKRKEKIDICEEPRRCKWIRKEKY